MWGSLIGEHSTSVGKQGRVSRPDGTNLRRRPLAGDAPLTNVPFNSLVQVQRVTDHGWAWIAVLEGGAAGQTGFVVADRVATDLPEPMAQLHWVTGGERLGAIAERYYGAALSKQDNERLFVQALYEANKDRAGVYLDPVTLPLKDTVHRCEAAEESLRIFKGLKVKKDHALWIPSAAFVQALKQAGAISDGRSSLSHAWDAAADLAGDAVDFATYGAGFTVGLLEGAWKAVVDLFKGAVEMLETVAKTLLHALTGNFAAIKAMAMGLVDKLKVAWANRGALADAFLAKWNAEAAWDRGLFQGEVIGWVIATVLLILATVGESAVATALGSSAWGSRFLSAVRTADALGDVMVYARGFSRAIKLPEKAVGAMRKEWKAVETAVEGAEDASHGSPTRQIEEQTVSSLLQTFRRGSKIRSLGAVSLKKLRLVLGKAGVKPGRFALVKATKQQLEELGDAAENIYGWVGRNGAGEVIRDTAGRPIINFTPKGLASLEDAVKTFGHEAKHLKDFAAGMATSSEAAAEEAGEKLWLVVEEMLRK